MKQFYRVDTKTPARNFNENKNENEKRITKLMVLHDLIMFTSEGRTSSPRTVCEVSKLLWRELTKYTQEVDWPTIQLLPGCSLGPVPCCAEDNGQTYPRFPGKQCRHELCISLSIRTQIQFARELAIANPHPPRILEDFNFNLKMRDLYCLCSPKSFFYPE